jgi:uncharacterized membrane protein YfcA
MHDWNILQFTLFVGTGSLAAGFIGALTGLGGGVVIIPLLSLVFGIDVRYAIGASLVSVIATSSGAAAAYVKEGFSNIRIGMFLEIATTIGALIGAFLATKIPTDAIAVIFGVILIFSAWMSSREHREHREKHRSHPWAEKLKMNSTYPTQEGLQSYTVQAVPGFWTDDDRRDPFGAFGDRLRRV